MGGSGGDGRLALIVGATGGIAQPFGAVLAESGFTLGVGGRGRIKAQADFLTQAMALEWGSAGILVNAILPGYLETSLTSCFLASPPGQEITPSFSRPRAGEVSDPGGALRLLASFDSDFSKESLLTVDDGQNLSIRCLARSTTWRRRTRSSSPAPSRARSTRPRCRRTCR